MKKVFFSLLVIMILFLFNDNYAQNSHDGVNPTPITASITAKGTVLSPISITTTRDLDFGIDILPGITKAIDKVSNSGGKFSINGEAGKEVNITITAPTSLYSGTNTLPISFSQTDAGYKVTGGTIIDFDPANPVNANIGSDGALEIYLGGSVVPVFTQVAGDYVGTVVVVFNYTGN
ncbi:MAG: DUF4402 domain-containing protein [Ignavibacteria bacterium]|jgi:hypothetical protein